MEEFYCIGDFSDSRDPESFVPAERDMASIELALEVLAKQEQDAAVVEKLRADEAKERKAEGRTDDVMRRIEMDKLERAEREAAKEAARQREAAREVKEKEAKKRQRAEGGTSESPQAANDETAEIPPGGEVATT